MLEAEESSTRLHFMSTSRDRPSREVPSKLSAWKILSVTFLPFTYTIYTLITHKSMRGHSEIKTLTKFFTTQHIHLLERESYSSLVRNHYNHFSFPLPLPYLESLRGDLYPNTTHTFSECRECFGAWEALGICQKKPVRLG